MKSVSSMGWGVRIFPEISEGAARRLTSTRTIALLAGVSVLAGCANVQTRHLAEDESPVVQGSIPRRNYTPLEPAFSCLAQTMRDKKAPIAGVAVGDVKDFTGKYSQNEGNTITQGGALMVYSALGKLGGVIQLQERFDTRIAELELAYTDRRQLGDGRTHQVEQGKPAVPWLPYFGGTIQRSDYYIVGGITEVNYNIASSGFEAGVSNIGVRNRTYTMNVGVDLRIVDTRSLIVVRTISLQKQIVGHEVGANVYRFFNDTLIDLNGGSKRQEPLQLGVRTAIEQGVIELIAATVGIDPKDCIDKDYKKYNAFKNGEVPPPHAPDKPKTTPAAVAPAAPGLPRKEDDGVVVPPGTQSGLQPQNSVVNGNGNGGGAAQVPFDFGAATVSAQAMSAIEKVAQDVAQGKTATLKLLARDTEVWPPVQRRELTNQRIKVITDALVARGVDTGRIGVSWVPSPTDAAITREGAGMQLVATVVVGR